MGHYASEMGYVAPQQDKFERYLSLRNGYIGLGWVVVVDTSTDLWNCHMACPECFSTVHIDFIDKHTRYHVTACGRSCLSEGDDRG